MPGGRDEEDNRRPLGSRAWPIGRPDGSGPEAVGRWQPREADQPGAEKTAYETDGVLRVPRPASSADLRSHRVSARIVSALGQSVHVLSLPFPLIVAGYGQRRSRAKSRHRPWTLVPRRKLKVKCLKSKNRETN